VFFAEPWPDIFSNDTERQHGLDEALAETERLRHDYVALGYELLALPRESVAKRADFVLSTLGAADPHRRRDSQS
jgi:predicted ATPase